MRSSLGDSSAISELEPMQGLQVTPRSLRAPPVFRRSCRKVGCLLAISGWKRGSCAHTASSKGWRGRSASFSLPAAKQTPILRTTSSKAIILLFITMFILFLFETPVYRKSVTVFSVHGLFGCATISSRECRRHQAAPRGTPDSREILQSNDG
jgi:hypothetical protein